MLSRAALFAAVLAVAACLPSAVAGTSCLHDGSCDEGALSDDAALLQLTGLLHGAASLGTRSAGRDAEVPMNASNLSACIQDVTSEFGGKYPCVVKNTCAYNLSVACGETYFGEAASSGVHLPADKALCAGTCTVTRAVATRALLSDCFTDVTGEFNGKYACMVKNACDYEVASACGSDVWAVPTKSGNMIATQKQLEVCAGNCTLTKMTKERPACFVDATEDFKDQGLACVLDNKCAAAVVVKCPSKGSGYWVSQPGKGYVVPPWAAVCTEECTYA
mmetsp:Transcript_89830/g.290239  ORF Transcript_89830/g.290239 Transcript_89830/m.290239 type:complete len:277 (-) Transcript_89830:166-996(-)